MTRLRCGREQGPRKRLCALRASPERVCALRALGARGATGRRPRAPGTGFSPRLLTCQPRHSETPLPRQAPSPRRRAGSSARAAEGMEPAPPPGIACRLMLACPYTALCAEASARGWRTHGHAGCPRPASLLCLLAGRQKCPEIGALPRAACGQ